MNFHIAQKREIKKQGAGLELVSGQNDDGNILPRAPSTTCFYCFIEIPTFIFTRNFILISLLSLSSNLGSFQFDLSMGMTSFVIEFLATKGERCLREKQIQSNVLCIIYHLFYVLCKQKVCILTFLELKDIPSCHPNRKAPEDQRGLLGTRTLFELINILVGGPFHQSAISWQIDTSLYCNHQNTHTCVQMCKMSVFIIYVTFRDLYEMCWSECIGVKGYLESS